MRLSERFEHFRNAVQKDVEDNKRITVEETNARKRNAIKKLDEELQVKLKKYCGEQIEKIESEERKKNLRHRKRLPRKTHNASQRIPQRGL